MTCDEIIEELKVNASEKYKANVVKMGIPEEYSIGVSTAVVRAIAKKTGVSVAHHLNYKSYRTQMQGFSCGQLL